MTVADQPDLTLEEFEEQVTGSGQHEPAIGRFIIAAVTLAVAIAFLIVAMGLDIGTLAEPGSAVGPIVFGLVTVLGAVLSLIDSIRDGDHRAKLGRFNWRLVAFIAALLATAAAMPIVGYLVTTAVLSAVVMLLVGGIKWWKAVLYGAIIATATSYVFTAVFGVPLPTGELFILGDWS